MTFEWDEQKNQANQEKHGLAFDDVELVFSEPTITFEDDRADYGERRLITLGTLARRVVVIVHTPRGDGSRIISLRKANRRERQIYEKRLGES
ncbi:MAG: BrnT family toxin [Chloroflexota bacterium]